MTFEPSYFGLRRRPQIDLPDSSGAKTTQTVQAEQTEATVAEPSSTPDDGLTSKERAVAQFIANYESGAELASDLFSTLIAKLDENQIPYTKTTDTSGKTVLEFKLGNDTYRFITNEVSSSHRTSETDGIYKKLMSYINEFIKGNKTWTQLQTLLKNLDGVKYSGKSTDGITLGSSLNGTTDADKTQIIKLEYKGVLYTFKCNYAAAKDGKIGKNGKEILCFDASQIDDSIKGYFIEIATKTENGETTPIRYIMDENKIPASIKNLPAEEIPAALKAYLESAPERFEAALLDFIKGNVTRAQLEALLKDLGAKYSGKASDETTVLGSKLSGENNAKIQTITIEYNGKIYTVSCNYAAAKDGKKGLNGQEIAIYTYDQIASMGDYAIDVYFDEVYKEDDNTKYYALKPQYLALYGSSDEAVKEIEAIVNKFKTFRDGILEAAGIPDGYDEPNAKIESKDFVTNFRTAISSINNYLKDTYPDFTSKVQQECERAIVQKYGNTGATVKDLIDEYLRLVYSKVSAAPTDVELTNDEQEFINDVMDKSNEPDKSVEVWLLQKYHGTKTTPPAYFDNKPDVIYDIEDAIEALRKALKARFMSNGFTEEAFNELFDANKSTIAHKYENITEPNTVSYKTVVDDFLKLMYNTDEFQAKLAESKAEWEKVVAFADKIKSDFSFSAVKNDTTVKDSTKVPKGAEIKEFDEKGNVKSPNNTEVKQLFAQVFSVLKGYLGELDLSDAQLKNLIVAAWNAVVSGQTADMTASEFVGNLRNELLDILAKEGKYQAALAGDEVIESSESESAPEPEPEQGPSISQVAIDEWNSAVNALSLNNLGIEWDAKFNGGTNIDFDYTKANSKTKQVFEAVLTTIKSQLSADVLAELGGESGLRELLEKAWKNTAEAWQNLTGQTNICVSPLLTNLKAELLKLISVSTVSAASDESAESTSDGVRGNEVDGSKLSGLSDADKKKYFIYDVVEKKYYIDLSAIAELFDDVITEDDLRAKTIDDIIAAIKDKNLSLSSITGYDDNKEVKNTDSTRNAESTRTKANEAFKALLNAIKSKLLTYITSQIGYSRTTVEIDKIIDDILKNKDSNVYKAIHMDNYTYSFNTKEAIDAFIKDIDAWLADKENNPSLRSISEGDIIAAGFGDLINDETYFINDGRSYKLNVNLLNDNSKSPFAAYLNAGGRILNLEDLRKAIAYCTTIDDKSDAAGGIKGTRTGKVLNEFLNDSTTRFNYNYQINSDGSIDFGTTYLIRNLFGNLTTAESDAKNVFSDLKDALKNTYSAELTNVFGKDTQAIDNLFNLAMFRVLSNTIITPDTKQNDIIKKVMTEYKNLLDKVAKDTTGNARDYVVNYHNNMLNGKSPADMGGTQAQVNNGTAYYVWDSTEGNDNQIDLENTFSEETKYTIGNYTFTNGVKVKTVECSHPNDTKPLNEAIQKLLGKYVNDLLAQLIAAGKSEQEIEQAMINLVNDFNKAIETAIQKMDAAENEDHIKRQNVYRYNDDNSDVKYRTKHDGFSTVQGCLMQIIYEMEALKAKSIFG